MVPLAAALQPIILVISLPDCRPKGQDAVSPVRGRSRDEATSPTAIGNGTSPRSPGGSLRPLGQGRIRFTDKVGGVVLLQEARSCWAVCISRATRVGLN